MAETLPVLDYPTVGLVDLYIAKFDSEFSSSESAILKLFSVFPNNTDFGEILLKVSVVNDMYGTNIFQKVQLADHILSCQIDESICIGDRELIGKIASGHGIRSKRSEAGKEITFYSFATKYCAWHNSQCFPIFDNLLERLLSEYGRRDHFCTFRSGELRNYESFTKVIENFQAYYGLTKYSLKDLDKFLWTYAKERYTQRQASLAKT